MSPDSQTLLRELFVSSYDELLRFATAMARTPELAEDVVHDAFLRIWSRPHTLREAGAARAYLFRTVANAAVSNGRREVRRQQVPVPAGHPEPEDLNLSLDLRRQLASLPSRRRACLVLRFVLDLTEAQTAAALGVSVGTVKSQTHKGLKTLAGIVEAEGSRS